MAPSRPVILDTHVWVWAFEGLVPSLGRGGARAIEAAAQAGVLYVSAVSVWELITLIRRGRLKLTRDPQDWIAEARRPFRTTIAPITAEIAMDAADLPAFETGDPADRMIVATARAMGGDLVTADRALLAYGRDGHVHVRRAIRT